ncbi:MAG: recombinase family protein [Oscillospiraceae bacterium]|nr:recombinase family protein [Oscillospiraceae bacterium]
MRKNNAALYLRLSRDDGSDTESNSIVNQRAILQKYANDCGFDIAGEYVDDGWSGVSFDRPSLKRMLGDIADGKIGIVLCKDLSRFGRNNALVSHYTELVFPEGDIRFIAVDDGIDSAKGDNDIMPFKSVINEYYARDISRKIRSAYKAQALKGNYTGSVAPYGYMKSPANKYLLIPNPDTADTVRRIYRMAADGISPYAIAKSFTEEQILTPSAYNSRKSLYASGTDWSRNSIRGIIKNEVYLGHMVSGKHVTRSYKSKIIRSIPEQDRIRVENTHEALVDQETFDLAHKHLGIKRRANSPGFVNIFAGHLKCADCASGLQITYPAKNKPAFGYQCGRYRHYARRYCQNHYIRYDSLYEIVLAEIQEKMQYLKTHEEDLAQYARMLADQNSKRDSKHANADLDKSRLRLRELDMLIQRLAEQNAAGLISDERFVILSGAYEDEQKSLKAKISGLQCRISDRGSTVLDIRKYCEVTELSTALLGELIDTIVVYAPQYTQKKKNRTQKVEINFRFRLSL